MVQRTTKLVGYFCFFKWHQQIVVVVAVVVVDVVTILLLFWFFFFFFLEAFFLEMTIYLKTRSSSLSVADVIVFNEAEAQNAIQVLYVGRIY